MKTVLITGTSSGIGKAAAKYFASQGWNVAATMRSPEKEKELGLLKNVKLYALDVTRTDSIQNAVDSVIADFGQLDAVVNNAGYGADGVFEAMNDEVIYNQFNTNVFGLMRVTRPLYRTCGRAKAAPSFRLPPWAGGLHFRCSAFTTQQNGPWKALANRCITNFVPSTSK